MQAPLRQPSRHTAAAALPAAVKQDCTGSLPHLLRVSLEDVLLCMHDAARLLSYSLYHVWVAMAGGGGTNACRTARRATIFTGNSFCDHCLPQLSHNRGPSPNQPIPIHGGLNLRFIMQEDQHHHVTHSSNSINAIGPAQQKRKEEVITACFLSYVESGWLPCVAHALCHSSQQQAMDLLQESGGHCHGEMLQSPKLQNMPAFDCVQLCAVATAAGLL